MSTVTVNLPGIPEYIEMGGGGYKSVDALTLKEWREQKAALEATLSEAVHAVECWEALGMLKFGPLSEEPLP